MVTAAAAEKRFYLKASLLFYLAWILVFETVGKYAATLPTRDLTLGLDKMIPVAAVFVWPYELCYLFPFLPLQWGRKRKNARTSTVIQRRCALGPGRATIVCRACAGRARRANHPPES